jgi:hypothetical protein
MIWAYEKLRKDADADFDEGIGLSSHVFWSGNRFSGSGIRFDEWHKSLVD